jgi:hypothetical protein
VPAPRGTTGTPARGTPEHGHDLLLAIRQHHNHRQLAISGQAVALIRTGILQRRQHGARRQHLQQRRRHLLPPCAKISNSVHGIVYLKTQIETRL